MPIINPKRPWPSAAFVLAALIGLPTPGHADLATAIDAYLAPYADAGQISGNLLVARGDDVLYERSFGMADYEDSVAVTPQTLFCVASVTKPMTLVIAVKLIEAGAIGMNDPLDKWIPGFPRGDRITFLHVLRHRAGFPHRVTTPEEETRPISSQEMVQRMMAYVQKNGLLCEPGEKSIYSSAGYSVAARVCELASGETYAALLQRDVFDPAKMSHSFDATLGDAMPAHAESYTDAWPGVRAAEKKDYSFLVGAGSVYSTSRDLYAFLHAVADTVYGASVRQSLLHDGGMHENGITNGYRAFADYDAATDVYVVFTGNRHTGAVEALRKDVPRLVAGEDVATPKLPVVHRFALSQEQIQRLEGSWTSQTGSDFEVTAKDGLVYAGWYALVPTSDTTFFSPQDYATVTFTVENGRAVRITWETEGDPLVWTRADP